MNDNDVASKCANIKLHQRKMETNMIKCSHIHMKETSEKKSCDCVEWTNKPSDTFDYLKAAHKNHK